MPQQIIEHDQHSIGTDSTAEATEERHEAAVEEIKSVSLKTVVKIRFNFRS